MDPMRNELVQELDISGTACAEYQEPTSLTGILQQSSVAEYSGVVIAEQIERLRSLASDVDRQYAVNVRGRKISFKSRVAYLGVREKVAAIFVGLVEGLLRLQPIESPKGSNDREPDEGAISWDPDDDGRGGAQR